MDIKNYHQKRDFKKTPEPKGVLKKSPKKKTHANNLFVIQKHAASHLHYDFRLELDGVLLSWAVPKGPCLDPAVKRLAVHVEDHPLDYANFEGTIPKGQYGAGTVMIWDKGIWICKDANAKQAYHKGHLSFLLEGKKLKGEWKLIRMHNDDKTWLLFKVKDKFADSSSCGADSSSRGLSAGSTTSSRHLDPADKPRDDGFEGLDGGFELQNRMPKKIIPQLATLVDKPPLGKEWLHEIKFDGYRLIAFKEKKDVRLMTRNNNDWTDKFAAIAKAVSQLPVKNAILDGEVVMLDKNQRSDFQLLQNAIKEDKAQLFIYYLFDLLFLDQHDLMQLPLIERKKLLQQLVPDTDGSILRYSDHVIGSGKKVLQNACKLELEGIISKNAEQPYIQGRGKSWLKIKCLKRQEFIIAGFTKPQGHREFFGSLLLGAYAHGKLIYHGHVGTGFTEQSLKDLYALFLKNKTNKMPFAKKPPAVREVSWLKPVLIAEVEFTEWTEDGYLRHPSFKGLRSDKPAKQIIQETAMPIAKVTHATKLFYPEDHISKIELINYYAEIKDWILPYIVNRPLSLVRCPDGYKKCFYQKHLTQGMPKSLYGKMIKTKTSKEKCIYLKDADGLLALPQLGVLEIHPWGSRITEVEYPDMIIFDLDPAPGLSWKKIVEAALEVKKHLLDFKLQSFVKTTGGKGLHVVVPIKPEYDWDEIKNFAHVFVNFMVLQHPKKYIDKMTKSKRTGKLFLDYMRNMRGATAVAPYSTRARRGAPVATPLDWDELTANQRDTFYDLRTLPERLAKLKEDPWQDFFKLKQSLHLDKLQSV